MKSESTWSSCSLPYSRLSELHTAGRSPSSCSSQGHQPVVEREPVDGGLFQIKVVDLESVRRLCVRRDVAQSHPPVDVHVIHGDAGASFVPQRAVVGDHRIDFRVGVEARQREDAARIPFCDRVTCLLSLHAFTPPKSDAGAAWDRKWQTAKGRASPRRCRMEVLRAEAATKHAGARGACHWRTVEACVIRTT